MSLQNNEKFIAFALLVLAVMLLTGIMIFHEPAEGSLRIVDAAVGGLLLALGMAANALFRSKSDALTEKAVDKIPPVTGEAARSEEEGAAWTR